MILSDFLGVDFTSSPLQTSPRRSPRAVNWITDRSGHNCKRGGWQQVYDLPPNADGTPRRINGMWQFDEGGRTVLLVHAGDALYRSLGAVGTDGYRFESVWGGESGLEDGRSQGFFFGGRLYLTGVGAYAVYGTWDGGESYRLRPVAECEDVYVPTTTVGIGPIGSDTEGGESVEAVNRLTRWRINTLVGSGTSGGNGDKYRLDGGIDGDALAAGLISVKAECEDGDGSILTRTLNYVSQGIDNAVCRTFEIRDRKDGVHYAHVTVYKDGRPTTLWLNFACLPPVPDTPNITVKFVAYEEEEGALAAVIGNCRFGAVFGAGGNANRLVLSGNPAYPNMQYWCEIGDPTYFPDRLSSVVGSSSVPITGMMRLSDGVLAVFKDDVGQEPTIYYQQASEDVSGTAASGNLPLTITTVAGNVGEAVVSRAACADFFGDPLILSRNGVFGITMRANVATGDRYAVERSHFISRRLCAEKLSEAVATVHDGRYYLAVAGSCYVADAEHRATPPGGSHYQYEWWYWDNLPARVFCTFGGELWFGTDHGLVCRVRRDTFCDESYERFSEGQVTGGTDISLVVSDALDVHVGDRMTFWHRKYTELGNLIVSGDAVGLVTPLYASDMEYIAVGVYLTNLFEIPPITQTGIPIPAYTRFIVDEVREEGSFTISYVNWDGSAGARVNLTDYVESGKDTAYATFSVLSNEYFEIKDELYVIDMDEKTREVTVSKERGGDPYEMPRYFNPELSQGKIIRETPISAEWYTPMLDLGSAMHRKTLLRLSTACEPGLGGRMEVGYETRRTLGVHTAPGGESGLLDLSDLNFSDFTFDGFASSHTVRLNERRVNYVRFRVRSEGAQDCRVHELRVVYRVDRECRGVE